MTDIHVSIDRLILHGPPEGLDPGLAQDLGALLMARLQELAGGRHVDMPNPRRSESHRIADQVADEVWRTVVLQREASR